MSTGDGRGLDPEMGGYIVDYVLGVTCLFYGTFLLVTSSRVLDKSWRQSGRTIAVASIQYGTAGLALLGGLCHQYLQDVSFM